MRWIKQAMDQSFLSAHLCFIFLAASSVFLLCLWQKNKPFSPGRALNVPQSERVHGFRVKVEPTSSQVLTQAITGEDRKLPVIAILWVPELHLHVIKSTRVYKCRWRVRLMVCVCSVLCIRGPDVLRMHSEQHLTVSTHPLSTCTCCTAVRLQTKLSGLFLLCRIKMTGWGKNGPTDTIAGGGERCDTITSSFMMMTQSLITWNKPFWMISKWSSRRSS